jgi:HSP20 family molecular chaperone IbpA
MEQKEKRVVVPMIHTGHNEDDTGLNILVDLAGASKESVQLDMGKEGFCIKAEADDFRYESCFRLAHTVRSEEAKAKFQSGLLAIQVPLDDLMHGHRVAVE